MSEAMYFGRLNGIGADWSKRSRLRSNRFLSRVKMNQMIPLALVRNYNTKAILLSGLTLQHKVLVKGYTVQITSFQVTRAESYQIAEIL